MARHLLPLFRLQLATQAMQKTGFQQGSGPYAKEYQGLLLDSQGLDLLRSVTDSASLDDPARPLDRLDATASTPPPSPTSTCTAADRLPPHGPYHRGPI
ncbi:hypothetical protein C2E23DRAFT_239389 [Lenzites betulinus]|nr:hypothetical protein C2E23DRAFT_239389 [Lenzites betulinus]